MPLTKVCPQCSAVVNCRKSVCVCGYAFNTRKLKSPRERKTAKSVDKAEKRAAETPTETHVRQERDRNRKATKKASELPAERLDIGRNVIELIELQREHQSHQQKD